MILFPLNLYSKMHIFMPELASVLNPNKKFEGQFLKNFSTEIKSKIIF